MKLFYYLINTLISLQSLHAVTFPTKAVTKVPVADLVGSPLQDFFNTREILSHYNNLPSCGQGAQSCYRIHQLIFNEVVTLVEQRGDEVLVRIPSLFYERENSSQRHDSYWSLKKNFATFDELAHAGISGDYFPDPLDYKNPHEVSKKKIVTLLFPFQDVATNQSFSVGTRFVTNSAKTTKNSYAVFIMDYACKRMKTVFIPVNLCRAEWIAEPFHKKVHNFITLLKSWANKGTIPYVWGGCSFTHYCPSKQFEVVKKNQQEYYEWPPYKEGPKNGFDCTGLIARAAQISGIPYYFKNSITIMKNLKELSAQEHLVAGDIIYFAGHVMVVADLKKNTIIEARAYNHGFGKIHEIALAKVFQGVETFAQLEEKFKKKQPLYRLESNGKVAQTIAQFKLLKLEGIQMSS